MKVPNHRGNGTVQQFATPNFVPDRRNAALTGSRQPRGDLQKKVTRTESKAVTEPQRGGGFLRGAAVGFFVGLNGRISSGSTISVQES
jgi:hypothetical protein